MERLLSISGEDMLTIDRKFRDPWTGKLPSRFVILSNELPRFGDASGAVAHRFIVLTLAHSWLGKENPWLTDQLLAELPGILSWSLDGLDQLTTNGKFTEPDSSGDAVLALQDLVSPVAAFVRDVCATGAGLEVPVSELYAAWRGWCEDNGRDKPGTVQTFGRDLRAVVPALRVHRPRAKDGQTRLPRRYLGIAKESSTHNDGNRGPSRSGQTGNLSTHTVDRDGPRPTPLQAQLAHDDDAPGDFCDGTPTQVDPHGRRICAPCSQLRCRRCQRLADRLIPPHGLCPSCAYPGGDAPDDYYEEAS